MTKRKLESTIFELLIGLIAVAILYGLVGKIIDRPVLAAVSAAQPTKEQQIIELRKRVTDLEEQVAIMKLTMRRFQLGEK